MAVQVEHRESVASAASAASGVGEAAATKPPALSKDVYVDMQYALAKVEESDWLREPWTYSEDTTNTYLSLRFDERANFKEKLKPGKAAGRIDHEIMRIAKTRNNFMSYEPKKGGKKNERMVDELKAALYEWKREAQKLAEGRIQELKGDGVWEKKQKKPGFARNLDDDIRLLNAVGHWNVNPDEKDNLDDFQPEPMYGFKACAMHFKPAESGGSGWVGYDHPHPNYKGKFPNQKLRVDQLLYDAEERNVLFKNDSDEFYKESNGEEAAEAKGKSKATGGERQKTLRYFHFPSNNMKWIEDAMARYYDEQPGDHDNLKPHKDMTNAEKILCREYWRGQLHGSGTGKHGNTMTKGPVHARHMRSRCSIIPLDASSGMYESKPIPMATDPVGEGKNFAVFLPYLHWETESRRAKMAAVIKEVTAEEDEERRKLGANDPPPPKRLMHQIVEAEARRVDKELRQHDRALAMEKAMEKTGLTPRNETKLGAYLLKLAKVADSMDYEADERLLRDSLHQDPPLHIRRTLDQSYFFTLEDTGARDRDQVVYRETRAGRSFHTRNTRVVMVDQLWLWILDDHTIITSFPRRWGRNKPDPSGVHKSLRDRLSNTRQEPIQSIYHLALIIIDQCSRVFFDRTKPLDQRPEVMDLFASAIGNVTDHTSIAMETFWNHMSLRSLYPDSYMGVSANGDSSSKQKYLDINPEGILVREAQDIAEELRIMLRIYAQQEHVVRDLRKYLGQLNGEFRTERDDVRNILRLLEEWHDERCTRHEQQQAGQVSIKEDADGGPVDVRHRLQRLHSYSTSFYYHDATSSQAAATRRRRRLDLSLQNTIPAADDLLVDIGNRKAEIQDLEDAAQRTCGRLQELLTLKQQQASIIEAKLALRRAEESARQGRTILAFTLVTIFFLPLGFCAAFFGMNNQEITGQPWMTLNDQIRYMFGVSAAVIVIALSTVFSPGIRALVKLSVRVPFAYALSYSGIHAAYASSWMNHAHLEGVARGKLAVIRQREDTLTEKRRLRQLVIDRIGNETVQGPTGQNGSESADTNDVEKDCTVVEGDHVMARLRRLLGMSSQTAHVAANGGTSTTAFFFRKGYPADLESRV